LKILATTPLLESRASEILFGFKTLKEQTFLESAAIVISNDLVVKSLVTSIVEDYSLPQSVVDVLGHESLCAYVKLTFSNLGIS
jgi:hypothetical protein